MVLSCLGCYMYMYMQELLLHNNMLLNVHVGVGTNVLYFS